MAAGYQRALKGVLAMVFPHMRAILPLSFVMSRKLHVNCSTAKGSVSSFIGTRATSFSGVYPYAPHSAVLFCGSNFSCAGQLETISIHCDGFKSMNRLYSPAGTVFSPNVSGTSVLSRVVTF